MRKMKAMAISVYTAGLILTLVMMVALIISSTVERNVESVEVRVGNSVYLMRDALDLTKSYIDTAVRYSVYQAAFDNGMRGGFSGTDSMKYVDHDGNDLALWYDDGDISPSEDSFMESLSEESFSNFGVYVSQGSVIEIYPVKIPPYGQMSIQSINGYEMRAVMDSSSELAISKKTEETDEIEITTPAEVDTTFHLPYMMLFSEAKKYFSELRGKLSSCSRLDIKKEVDTFCCSVKSEVIESEKGSCIVKVEASTKKKYLLWNGNDASFEHVKLVFAVKKGGGGTVTVKVTLSDAGSPVRAKVKVCNGDTGVCRDAVQTDASGTAEIEVGEEDDVIKVTDDDESKDSTSVTICPEESSEEETCTVPEKTAQTGNTVEFDIPDEVTDSVSKEQEPVTYEVTVENDGKQAEGTVEVCDSTGDVCTTPVEIEDGKAEVSVSSAHEKIRVTEKLVPLKSIEVNLCTDVDEQELAPMCVMPQLTDTEGKVDIPEELKPKIPFEAAMSAPALGRVGEQASFAASSNKDNVESYEWDFGDGTATSITSSASIEHTYESEGTYTVELTVVLDTWETVTVSEEFIVRPGPLETVRRIEFSFEPEEISIVENVMVCDTSGIVCDDPVDLDDEGKVTLEVDQTDVVKVRAAEPLALLEPKYCLIETKAPSCGLATVKKTTIIKTEIPKNLVDESNKIEVGSLVPSEGSVQSCSETECSEPVNANEEGEVSIQTSPGDSYVKINGVRDSIENIAPHICTDDTIKPLCIVEDIEIDQEMQIEIDKILSEMEAVIGRISLETEIGRIDYLMRDRFIIDDSEPVMIVHGSAQKMYILSRSGESVSIDKEYDISTGIAGFGNVYGSGKTPIGVHKIKEKIGAGSPLGTIFKARADTGRIATIYTDSTNVPEDLVTSRIMWLDGAEGRSATTGPRQIYIHGTQEEGLIGEPVSHGCIRMKNEDAMELFDIVEDGTYVNIFENLPIGSGSQLVVIDPGHGGIDPGAISSSGIKEEDVNLAIAKSLRDDLMLSGIDVILTRDTDTMVNTMSHDINRDGDYTVSDRQLARTYVANENDADIFISIHSNSNPDSKETGTEVYIFCYANEKAYGNKMLDYSYPISDYCREHAGPAGFSSNYALAESVLPRVTSVGIADRGIRGADMTVLENAQMPAILIEVGYLSDPEEAIFINNPANQELIASAISDGVNLFSIGVEQDIYADAQ